MMSAELAKNEVVFKQVTTPDQLTRMLRGAQAVQGLGGARACTAPGSSDHRQTYKLTLL